MGLITRFVKTMWRGSKPIFAWVAVMMALNAVLPLVFWSRTEARVVLAVFMVSAAVMMALFRACGFTRITGLGHALWLALVPWLASRLDLSGGLTPFQTWLLATIVVNGISVVIDATDVVRYVRGDRSPVLPAVD